MIEICGLRGEWKKSHNEELVDLYYSVSTVRAAKLRSRWVEHVARIRMMTLTD